MDQHFHSSHAKTRLGDFVLKTQSPLNEKNIFELCHRADFKQKPLHEKIHLVFESLIHDILLIPEPVFLFPSLVKLFEALNKEGLFTEIPFAYFEFWLNQYSNLSDEDNYKIRAKVVGKFIPRNHYQIYFPIGQNKTYFGSHFVTAHSSPDLDTTVASFWGWMDAFGARVAEGLHHWNVPGGAPSYQVEFKLIFDDVFSPYLFHCVAKHRGALSVTSLELLTQKGMIKRYVEASSLSLDLEKNSQAVVLVDQAGYYQGDWRTQDIEGVRQVVMLVNQMLRHFENHFQQELIALFSKDDLKKSDLLPNIHSLLKMKLIEAEPLKELSDRQRKHVDDYLKQVLYVSGGLDADIESMAKGLSLVGVSHFESFIKLVNSQLFNTLFNASGELTASRSLLFKTLDQIAQSLNEAIHAARKYVDQLRISLKIKSKVFDYKPLHVQEKSDVEELRSKMGNSQYLTVTMNDEKGLIPIGVIHASDLYKPVLGTVTVRDFSNRDETKIPSYLEVISCVDHHKSQLSGVTPATIYICDAQSSNTKVAELAFTINDRFSTSGMTKEGILHQLGTMNLKTASNSERRIYRRLIQKLEAFDKRGSYFIDSTREYVEYQQFLFAILDDTDMLSKVTYQDVDIVKELINRMKTIITQQETEVVHFDDISEGPDFVQAAASRLLRNADLYSITQKIYKNKETFIDQVIENSAHGIQNLFFADTKEQNGCVRIGQFKLYPINYSVYKKHQQALQLAFMNESLKVSSRKKEIDLHLFMVSTLTSLEALFDHKARHSEHLDEIWIYIPQDVEGGASHLRAFFNSFGASSGAQKSIKGVRVLGRHPLLEEIIESTLLNQIKVPFEKIENKKGDSLIILDVLSGSMNSRKAMITPFLPKLVV
jgi:hypothetical protein